MKKIFLGISMMLLSALSFSVAAQNQEAKQCAKEKCAQEQCDKEKKCDKGECPVAKCDKENCPEGKKCDKTKNCGKAECKAVKCDKEGKRCHGDSAMRGHRFDKKGRPDGRGPKGMMPGDRMKNVQKGAMRAQLFKGIDLTEDQKAKLDALDQKMADERIAARAEVKEKSEEAKDVTKEAKAEAKADLKKAKNASREAYDKALQEILTKEQYAKYEVNREEMKMRHGARKDMGRLKADVSKVKVTETEKPLDKTE